jgi:hypothetical protein
MSKTLFKVVVLLPPELILYLVAIDRITTVVARAVADKRDKVAVSLDVGGYTPEPGIDF